MRSAKLPLFIAAVLSISFVVRGQQRSSPVMMDELINAIRQVVEEERIPGLMLGIVTRDSILFSGGFGYADIGSKRAVDGTTRFRVGSITKMLVSLGILKLVEQGKLHLEDPLRQVAPGVPFESRWEAEDPVRIINLLEHTAGFDDARPNRLFSFDTVSSTAREMMLYQKRSLVCRWRPGERFAYSNADYAVLGYILENLSGMPFERYLEQEILRPLGMTHSSLDAWSKMEGSDVKEYVVRGSRQVRIPSVTCLPVAAGALWSGADDMSRFVQAFIRAGSPARPGDALPLFSDTLIRSMETPGSNLEARAHLLSGYAKANTGDFYFHKYLWRGHRGLIGSCFSTLAYNRELGVGFVLSNNGNRSNSDIEELIVDFLEQGSPGRRLDTIATDLSEMRPFLGTYEFGSPRFCFVAFRDRLLAAQRVYVSGNALYIRPLFGVATRLVATGPGTFAWEGANSATVVFTRNRDGKKVLCIEGSYDGTYYEKTSRIRLYGILGSCVLALLFALSSLFVGVYAIIACLLGKRPWRTLPLRVIPMLAVAFLIWALLALSQVQQESYLLADLARVDERTLTIFSGTLLYGLLSAVECIWIAIWWARNDKKLPMVAFANGWSATYWSVTAISLGYIATILLLNGWIGLRVWAM